ncbi:MAG: class I SAM-dependent methyltransferase [Actinomycetota bacterium]|nr:class I SAM-dependent methyltransferase [Actinomycetota bacterium]
MAPLLVCPRCACRLVEASGAYRCSSPSCHCAPGGFPTIGHWPVLVDFEHSVLQRDALETSSASGIARDCAPRTPLIERLPRRLRGWWKPHNQVAERKIEVLLSLLSDTSPLVVVVGGATIGNGIDAIYIDPRIRVLGFDIRGSPITQFIGDAHEIPLADGSVDALVVQAVLEHVLHPEQVVAEIHRVLRDDGLVYAETPFLQQVHAGAYDFVRFTASGHRYLFRAFDELDAGPVAGPGTQLLWSIDHLVRGLTRSDSAGRAVRAGLGWLRRLDRWVPRAYAMDNASAYFFLGRRSLTELTPHEVVEYYQGAQGNRL